MFSSPSRRFSLCVHGCDHTRAEFLGEDSQLRAKSRRALQRMRAHERLSGATFDAVMVFPQGLFSSDALAALKAAGYLAAVNTDLHPQGGSAPLTLRDLLDVAVLRYGNFALFGRRYPRDLPDFAFDLLLGKPLLAVEHHGYFRHGYGPVCEFVRNLNALEKNLEWTNLAAICSQSCLLREGEGGKVQVRFYTEQFTFTNEGAEAREFSFLRRQQAGEPLPRVKVNGQDRPASLVGEDLMYEGQLGPGERMEIQLLSGSTAEPECGDVAVLYKAKVFARRLLSEMRDNYFDTNPVLAAMVTAARKGTRALARSGVRTSA